MAIRMQQRRGTAAQWAAANPVLAAGEIGFETDTGKFKIGDGNSTWSLLKYFLNLDALDIDAEGFITDDQKGVNNGVATLDSSGLIPVEQLPDAYLTNKINTKIGEVVGSAPATLNTLQEIAEAFNNNPDYADSISAALDLKAPKHDPSITGTASLQHATFTGDVLVSGSMTVPAPASNDVSTKAATTAFVKNKIDGVVTDLNTYQSNTSLSITTLTNNIAGVAEDVVDLQTSVTSINTSLTDINGDISTLQANDISQQNSTDALDVRLDAAESTITGHTSSINILDGRLDNAEDDINALETRVTSTESGITSINTTVSGVQTNITSLTSDLNSTKTNVTNLQSGLVSTNGNVSTLQSNYTALDTTVSGKVDKAGSTMTGALTLSGAPTSNLHAATKKYVDDTVSTHEADTTNVHGIANTADLATKSYADNAKAEAISTSATAIDLKANIASPTFTGTVVLPATTSIGTVSATEIGYVDGVTSAIQTQLDAKAPLASPALTGTPTAPTATAGTNTTQVATTAFVKTAVDNVVAAAPGALDTLNELAAALGNDANFSTTLTNNLAAKAPLASPTFTGTVVLPSSTSIGNVSATEIGYVDGVTSSIQTQLDAKAPSANPTLTGTVALPATSSVTFGGTALSTTLATKSDNAAVINTMSGSHTIVSADVNNIREMSNGGTITIPSDNSFWPVGATMDVIQTGSSQVTIGAGSGVTLNATPGLKLRAQWSSATILKRAANTFVALGDLSA